MPVYLIAGPPCSGKSALAGRLAKPGDQILDFDLICTELDGRPGWTHDKLVREQAADVMAQRLARLHRHDGNAYVIRSAPTAGERTDMARQLNATVWLLNPGPQECLRRAEVDGRPLSTVRGIHDWYARYRPAPVDQAPPGLG